MAKRITRDIRFRRTKFKSTIDSKWKNWTGKWTARSELRLLLVQIDFTPVPKSPQYIDNLIRKMDRKHKTVRQIKKWYENHWGPNTENRKRLESKYPHLEFGLFQENRLLEILP